MIPLKNPTLYSKTFSCLCSQCRIKFVIVVDPTTIGKAICPDCQSEKIFVDYQNTENFDITEV